MIDINAIQEGIIQTLNSLVGKDACPNRQKFTSPVIKAKTKGVVPSYPVVVVDKLPTNQYGISSVTDEYINDDENLVRETRYKLSFLIQVHGSIDDNVLAIAQEIRDTFFRTYGMETLHTNTGAGLLGVTSPTFSFNYLQTDYEEVARLTLDMSATDIFIETDPNCPSTGFIENIVIDGELKENEDDTDPLTTQSTAP